MKNLKKFLNYSVFMNDLRNIITAQGLFCETLGKVNGEPILFIGNGQIEIGKKNILISAGFHGNERSGPWGVLEFLRHYGSDAFQNVNISFLPLVNPNGFLNGDRENAVKEDPNRGWTKNPSKHASEEGRVLLSSFQAVYNASIDGFLTLHESSGDTFFVVSYDDDDIVTNKIKRVGELFFKADKRKIEPLNDTLETLLHNMGVPITIVTEIPQVSDMQNRIDASVAVIKAFVDYFERAEWNK